MKHPVLKDNFDLYSHIFNTLANPIFVKNDHHRFIMVNDAFCSLFQVKREEFVGRTDDELFPEKEWRIFREKDRKILTTGISDENEEYATTQDGKRLRVLTRKSLLQDSTGKKFVLGIVTDITERAELLERLSESEKKFKTIFNLGSDPSGLFLYPERLAVEVNNAFLRVGGVTRKSVIGKQATHAFAWVDPVERDAYFKILEKKKGVRNMEIHLRTKHGEVLPFLVSSKMIRINRKWFVLYTLRDIFDQKKAEAILRESEMMYREMVDNSPIPLFIHREGIIVFANDAATLFSGIRKERLTGKKIHEVVKLPAIRGKRQNVNLLFQDSTNAGNTSDVLLETKEGIPRNYLVRNVGIRYKGEDAIMTKILDITERQNLEKYIFNKILETEENERKRLAADLHDDLGPLLSTIKLHLGMLEKARDPGRTQKSIETFDTLLDEVIKKVHEISHMISPHLIEDFGLAGALNDFCHQVNVNKIFHVDFIHNLEHLRFSKEIELHYYRIIGELLNNSMKHSGSREMKIDLKYAKGILKLRYYDTGMGYKVRETLANSMGMGLSNIINRVGLINGEVAFSRIKGKTLVEVKTRAEIEKRERSRQNRLT